MANALSSPVRPEMLIKKVGIIFAGGPAPAANAVISAAATSFLRAGVEVVGFKHGYSHLVEFDGATPLEEGRQFIKLTPRELARTRNSQGILIGTARTNPGKFVECCDDLDDPKKSKPLRNVYDALRSVNVDALISIGGDDTLRANKGTFYFYGRSRRRRLDSRLRY